MHLILLVVGVILAIAGIFNLAEKRWWAAIIFIVGAIILLAWGGIVVV